MKFSLGNVDTGSMPADKSSYFSRYHANLKGELLLRKQQFRDEVTSDWREFQEVPGTGIKEIQQFLKDAGFLPKTTLNGIYGYSTQAGVRLFQEFVRTVKGDPSIGVPDGVVGPNTLSHIQKWKQEKAGVCDWGKGSVQNPSNEFRQWIQVLEKAKSHFQANPGPIVSHIENYSKTSDTRKTSNWDTSSNVIHLIGIRRTQDTLANTANRESDDLFVLLINGMVFKFWGSTDPNPGIYSDKEKGKRNTLPFLVEGQHNYQFGWHKLGDEDKVYRALRPASNGVLVFRDKDGNRALTDLDIVKGLDSSPNPTINIHWSGIGRTNFSAGCQVIAGQSYINDKGDLVNCTGFAAKSYDELGNKKTRAAYNVLTDLLLSYGPPDVRTIVYTLGRDETLRFSDVWKENHVQEIIGRMKQG
ncbi:MAG: peptidoglycan-binding domain-containing protein [Saprospiraceae bacterium]